MKDRILLFIGSDYVPAVPPIAGGLIGIYSFFQQILPIISVLSILAGLIWGYLGHRMKRKLYLRQMQAFDGKLNGIEEQNKFI